MTASRSPIPPANGHAATDTSADEPTAAALPRTLVFCSAGSRIRELSWLPDLGRQQGMDAAIVYYGAAPLESPPPARYLLSHRDFKIPNFLHLLEQHESALDYELFMFIDDDIVISADDLARWRDIIAREQLDISQPALTPASKVSWPHVWVKPRLGTDREQFVEIQCFALSRRALRAALPFFFMVKTGFGLDLVLFHLASSGQLTSAVVHEVQMLHPHRDEAQTVRTQFAEFDRFKHHMMRLADFCFESQGSFTDVTIASHVLGDTRPATVRWVRSTRYIAGRLVRKFRRMTGLQA